MQESRKDVVQFINLRLASLGQPTFIDKLDSSDKFLDPKFEELTSGLVKSLQEKSRLLSNHHSPVDARIQQFIDDYLKDVPVNVNAKVYAAGYRGRCAKCINGFRRHLPHNIDKNVFDCFACLRWCDSMISQYIFNHEMAW